MYSEKEKIILRVAEDSFLHYGFKKTGVDAIANRLGISKKTIYKFFPTKVDLLNAVVENVKTRLSSALEEALTMRGNAVVKLYRVAEIVAERSSKITPFWLEDLRLNVPETWEDIEKFRREVFQKEMIELTERAKKEGLIVKKPTAVILTVILSAIEASVHPDFVLNNNLSARDSLKLSLEIVFAGILTAKGKKAFKQFEKAKRKK
jgi:AcrR family transcriptional regulator